MTFPDRAQAQQRADDINVFRAELSRLESEGALALSEAQRQTITAHQERILAQLSAACDIDSTPYAQKLSWGMRAASLLGALALSASLFFFFDQFWDGLNDILQVAILIGSSLATLSLTAWLVGRGVSPYFTQLVGMVSFTSFVLNVFMLGGLFNIAPSHHAFLPWSMLGFLLAYACASRLLLLAGVVCLVVFVTETVSQWGGLVGYRGFARPENFFPAAALLLGLARLAQGKPMAGFAQLYRDLGLLCLMGPILLGRFWGDLSYLNWDPKWVETGYELIGFTLSALMIKEGARHLWRNTLNLGIIFFIILFYARFYEWCWAALPNWLFFLLFGLSALVVLWVLKRLRLKGANT